MLPEAGLDGRRLAAEISALLAEPAIRRRMAGAAHSLAVPDALERILDAVQAAIRPRLGGGGPLAR